MQYGLNIARQGPHFTAIIDAPTPDALERVLMQEYIRHYNDSEQNRVGFHVKSFRTFSFFISLVVIGLSAALAYFVYDNVTKTRTYRVKMYIYQNYYDRNPLAVLDYASELREQDMDPSLKKVVADALIATNDPENLKRAFSLDYSRQAEIIEKLIALERTSDIAVLSSDNPFVQLYIAYYTKDYQKTIDLGDSNPHLKSNLQAQILLAKAYAALNDYVKAESVLGGPGNLTTLINAYEAHYREIEILASNDSAPEHQRMLRSLKETIDLLQEIRNTQSS
jgi:hypothetical protein